MSDVKNAKGAEQSAEPGELSKHETQQIALEILHTVAEI